MNTLKAFAVTLLLMAGTFTTQAQNTAADYLKLFATSFTDTTVTHRATNLFWSLCLGVEKELSNEELNKRYTALTTDSPARIAFYKRFNYYLSGKLSYYTDMLTLKYRYTLPEQMVTYTQLKELASTIHSYGQDPILEGSWNSGTGDTAQQVYAYTEELAQFPGGEMELINFLQKHLIYPEMERDNDLQGKVLVKFRVCDDGYLCTSSITRGVSPAIDAEAIRVLKMMPHWKPGKQAGKNVSVWYYIPFVFRLR